MYGRYKPSPITIMHWENELAKHTFEKYIYNRYNKHTPITIWDKNNKTVCFGSQPHRINFVTAEGLDVLLLTETQVNSSSVETHDGYFFCFSSDTLPGNSEREHAGVGSVVHTRFKPYLYEVKQTSGRVMAILLRSMGMCCYAPHGGHGIEVKEAFYDSVQELLTECPEAVYIGGDFNARLQYKHENESEVLGPQIFGGGRD